MEGQIMRVRRFLASCLVFIAFLTIVRQPRILAAISASAPAAASPDKQDKGSRPQPTRDGERLFRQNCARWHQVPESFPPQISGTIVRHMRVRASLSRDDERAILKFLNP